MKTRFGIRIFFGILNIFLWQVFNTTPALATRLIISSPTLLRTQETIRLLKKGLTPKDRKAILVISSSTVGEAEIDIEPDYQSESFNFQNVRAIIKSSTISVAVSVRFPHEPIKVWVGKQEGSKIILVEFEKNL